MIMMASPWEEAKGLVSTIVNETTAETQHPPSFHWLGDHTHLTWGLKELEWMPHISLVKELLQLTEVISKANPNTQELMSCISSQLELFYTSTHAQLQSLHYYCSTTLRRHMNDQLMLAVDKNYERLVLAVIGCIRATESLQMALGSLPDVLQAAYTRDIPGPTLFSIEEQHFMDESDILHTNDSSDDTDAEKCEFLNEQSASFEDNSINSSSNLQEARSGFLRLVMGEDPADGPTESMANIDRINGSGSISTEEFLWSLGEQVEDSERMFKAQKELNTLTSSAVTSLLTNTSKSIQGSTTMLENETKLGQQQWQHPHQQQQQHHHRQIEIPRTIAQHPLLPHRIHAFIENPASTINIKRPWESPKTSNANLNVVRKSPDCTKNTAKSPTLKKQIFSVGTLLTETSSDTSTQKVNERGKRPRNNTEESKDGPLRSAKRSRTSLEANASKMQKRFLSMVDQIVSSNFVDKLENSSINNDTKINSNNGISDVRSSMWVETDVKVNPADYQPDTKTLGKELKINTIEASPKNVDGQPLFSASTRPKAGFYKEIDYEFSSLEKDKNANLGIKDNSEVENFSKDENKTVNIIKTPEGKSTKASIKTKSKKGRGRPRKVKK